MRRARNCIAFIFLFCLFNFASEKKVQRLPDEWVYLSAPGDWSAEENGEAFREITGFAWYRVFVKIPAAWKGEKLRLNLGRIDDAGEVYVNGDKIASVGSLPPKPRSSKEPIVADIDPARIRFGDFNMLAVRVFNVSDGGGLVAKEISLSSNKGYLDLAGDWHFRAGDDPEWAALPENLNDAAKSYLVGAAVRPGQQTVEVGIDLAVASKTPYGTRLLAKNGNVNNVTHVSGPHCLPKISPDRKHLLVNSMRGGTAGIWKIAVDGETEERICDGRHATFAKNGQSIFFVRDGAIFERKLSDGVEKKITPDGFAACSFPDSSPTENEVLFVARREGANMNAVYVARLDGGAPRKLAEGEIASAPRFSPDGTEIVFQDGAHLKVATRDGKIEKLAGEGGVQSFPFYSSDGNGIGYFQSDGFSGLWQMRVRDRWHRVRSRRVPIGFVNFYNVIDNNFVDPGGDAVWTAKPIADAEGDEKMEIRTSENRVEFAHAGAEAVLRANEETIRKLTRDFKTLELPPAGDEIVFSAKGKISYAVLPDRLGDDVVLDAGSAVKKWDVSFAPVVLGMLDGGSGILLIAVPYAGRKIAVENDGGNLSITVDQNAGPVYAGIIACRKPIWFDNPEEMRIPFHGCWRTVFDEDGTRVANMIAGSNVAVGKTLAQQKPRLVYPFGRTADTPPDVWVVQDVLNGALGMVKGQTISQDNAVRNFHVAGIRTSWPTVDLMAKGIVESYRHGFDKLKDDIGALCDEVLAVLDAQDAQAAGYATFLASVRDHPTFSGLVPEGETSVARPDEIRELLSRIKSGDRDTALAKDFPDRLIGPSNRRAQTLVKMRRAVRKIRNAAKDVLLKNPADKGCLDVLERTNRLLEIKHYSEGDWRGEPVRLPSTRGWWGGTDNLKTRLL